MNRLTNYQRATLTNMWIKRGKEGELEDFIKKVCELKKIEYTQPTKRHNEEVKVVPYPPSSVFPT